MLHNLRPVAEAMIRHSLDGLVFYQFASLERHREVLHAIFTRRGGASVGPFRSLNVGERVGDDPAAVRANHDLIFQTLSISTEQVVTAHQEHGAHVALVGPSQRGTALPATDSLVSKAPGIALMLAFADCLPLMLYDPSRHIIALVHAGWRGVIAQVVASTVAVLRQSFGCDPADLLACLGPAIGPCCYEIGPELAQKIREVFGPPSGLLVPQSDGTLHFDLPAAVRRQLELAGIQHVENSDLCTSCHTEDFYSHRAENGRTGRFAAVLALRRSHIE